jgi:16S rRNA (adenine1518-N6/adenine1519-N6)-dimethyltransferase
MPKKHLSQNFLYNPALLRRIIQVADVGPEDTVVEIGPGPGRMTEMLTERAKKVIAIELDRDLYRKLKNKLSHAENFELIEGDALLYPYENIREPFKVVANIPYHITTPIIFKLLEHRDRLKSMTLTVQKEVAERVAAKPGNKTYGVLSVMVQYHGKAKSRFVISKGAFRPVPRVDSACLHIEITDTPTVSVKDEQLFKSVVRASFGQRRKTIKNSLGSLFSEAEEALRESDIDPGLRAERLSIEDFARISDSLYTLTANN